MGKGKGKVAAHIIKAEAPVAKAENPTQLDEKAGTALSEWLDPPADLRGLNAYVAHSSILPQCIRAYKNNIAGFGIGVRYKEDYPEETAEMKAEFVRAEEIIELLNLDMDTKEVFEDVIDARETFGIGYLEIVRNIAGEVTGIEFIKDTPSVRKTIPLDPYVEVKFFYKNRAEKRMKKFCKYRQQVGPRSVYFKEIGDPRILDNRTGEYVDELEIEHQANEILEFAIGTAAYGEVGKYSEEDVDLSEVSKGANDAPEKVGLFKRLAEHLGFSVVQKGAMLEAYEKSVKHSAFWNAFYTLEDLLYRYNWASDSYEYETNETAIRDALADFSTVLIDLLAESNIAKALTETAPLLKAGKKISSANQKKLEEAYQALTELRESLADDEADTTIEKEEIVLTKNEVQAMIEAAIAKAAETPAQAGPGTEALTAEAVQKMIDETVAKAVETPAPEGQTDETVTPESVQKMIDESVEKAVGSLRQVRGLPSNLNGEKTIEKTADVFAGLFV